MEGTAAARERVLGGRALSHPVMLMCVQNTNREALLIHWMVNLSKRNCYSNCLSHPHYLFIRALLHCGPHCSVPGDCATLRTARPVSGPGLSLPVSSHPPPSRRLLAAGGSVVDETHLLIGKGHRPKAPCGLR